jgi:hypothetical protein
MDESNKKSRSFSLPAGLSISLNTEDSECNSSGSFTKVTYRIVQFSSSITLCNNVCKHDKPAHFSKPEERKWIFYRECRLASDHSEERE